MLLTLNLLPVHRCTGHQTEEVWQHEEGSWGEDVG